MIKLSIIKILFFLAFCLQVCLFWGCAEPKSVSSKKHIINDSIDTYPNPDEAIIIRTVNGKDVKLKLDGKLHWIDNIQGDYHPLEVKEVYPGVVYFDKYYPPSDTLYPNRVKDRIEFFDKSYNLIKTFIIDDNNPFLRATDDVKVEQYVFNIGENYIVGRADSNVQNIITRHLVYSKIEYQNTFSKLLFSRLLVTDNNEILGEDSYFTILNKEGEILFSKMFPKLKTSFPKITRDGRFILFSILPIETVSNAGIKHQTEGFQIWDIENDRLVYKEWNDDPNMWIAEPTIDPQSGYLCIDYTFPNSKEKGQQLIIFSNREMILYSKTFTVEQWTEISLNWFKKYKSMDNLPNYFQFQEQKLK